MQMLNKIYTSLSIKSLQIDSTLLFQENKFTLTKFHATSAHDLNELDRILAKRKIVSEETDYPMENVETIFLSQR